MSSSSVGAPIAFAALIALQTACYHWVPSTPTELARTTESHTVRVSLRDGESFEVKGATLRLDAWGAHANGQGVAVLSVDPDAAWPVGRAVYADATLRPRMLDEVHARVLAGEAPSVDSPPDLRELAELRRGVSAEDSTSRQFLTTIARRLGLSGVLVVSVDEQHATIARVFFADTARFGTAIYRPENRGSEWSGAIASITESFRLVSNSPYVGSLVDADGLDVDVSRIAKLELRQLDAAPTAILTVVIVALGLVMLAGTTVTWSELASAGR